MKVTLARFQARPAGTPTLAAALAVVLLALAAPDPAAGMVTLDDLRDCRRIISMSIKYSWIEETGARLFSKHHFVFLDGEYEGYAYYAVKSDSLSEVKKIEGLEIPLGVMEAVTIILKDSPLRELEVAPAISSLEGKSHYEISLELCTEEVKFYSAYIGGVSSWAVTVAGKTYAVGNDAPQSAIKVLEPFMHFEMVERLKRAVFGEDPGVSGPAMPTERTLVKSQPRTQTQIQAQTQAQTPRKRNYRLVPAPRPFERIYFATADYQIDARYHLALFGMIDYLRSHPDVEVLVSGHCDERGDEDYNFALGEKRASSVISHLINRGADPSRIKSLSFGEERPVDSGHGEEAWQKNRRVEFHFYEYTDGG